MLDVGDKVFIEDSAQIDVGFLAWFYVDKHREVTVKQRMTFIEHDEDIPESEHLYAVEFQEVFQGGHFCQGNCLDGRGQFIASKHLSLCFEASRVVTTIPNIEADKLDKRISNIAAHDL